MMRGKSCLRVAQAVQVVKPWLFAAAIVLVVSTTVWACPNCKDSLADNDPSYSGAVQGYFWSILLMLSMPFLILGGLGGYFYYLVRQARKSGYWANQTAIASVSSSGFSSNPALSGGAS